MNDPRRPRCPHETRWTRYRDECIICWEEDHREQDGSSIGPGHTYNFEEVGHGTGSWADHIAVADPSAADYGLDADDSIDYESNALQFAESQGHEPSAITHVEDDHTDPPDANYAVDGVDGTEVSYSSQTPAVVQYTPATTMPESQTSHMYTYSDRSRDSPVYVDEGNDHGHGQAHDGDDGGDQEYDDAHYDPEWKDDDDVEERTFRLRELESYPWEQDERRINDIPPGPWNHIDRRRGTGP